uniref:Uncharacterized protein n=1 Tax=Chromera velia CCMP2878 TaxID=1169474 RepID=A0A0G4HUS4_9ALVE|eukprot:Cvel_8716.t1-p1 / transcript=Cvel_8716.t1 / gene=Cvel_8716 / organism=Chromera_velia_CCMP2878 / gene_product=Plectin, putative / transcript_product=Plectin, putative / location=Cvel_scaffold487:19200-31242(+) / protein_length=1117 / sequence_SO=supercontig / SO=protein_coding / is_pseudo=false
MSLVVNRNKGSPPGGSRERVNVSPSPRRMQVQMQTQQHPQDSEPRRGRSMVTSSSSSERHIQRQVPQQQPGAPIGGIQKTDVAMQRGTAPRAQGHPARTNTNVAAPHIVPSAPSASAQQRTSESLLEENEALRVELRTQAEEFRCRLASVQAALGGARRQLVGLSSSSAKKEREKRRQLAGRGGMTERGRGDLGAPRGSRPLSLSRSVGGRGEGTDSNENGDRERGGGGRETERDDDFQRRRRLETEVRALRLAVRSCQHRESAENLMEKFERILSEGRAESAQMLRSAEEEAARIREEVAGSASAVLQNVEEEAETLLQKLKEANSRAMKTEDERTELLQRNVELHRQIALREAEVGDERRSSASQLASWQRRVRDAEARAASAEQKMSRLEAQVQEGRGRVEAAQLHWRQWASKRAHEAEGTSLERVREAEEDRDREREKSVALAAQVESLQSQLDKSRSPSPPSPNGGATGAEDKEKRRGRKEGAPQKGGEKGKGEFGLMSLDDVAEEGRGPLVSLAGSLQQRLESVLKENALLRRRVAVAMSQKERADRERDVWEAAAGDKALDQTLEALRRSTGDVNGSLSLPRTGQTQAERSEGGAFLSLSGPLPASFSASPAEFQKQARRRDSVGCDEGGEDGEGTEGLEETRQKLFLASRETELLRALRSKLRIALETREKQLEAAVIENDSLRSRLASAEERTEKLEGETPGLICKAREEGESAGRSAERHEHELLGARLERQWSEERLKLEAAVKEAEAARDEMRNLLREATTRADSEAERRGAISAESDRKAAEAGKEKLELVTELQRVRQRASKVHAELQTLRKDAADARISREKERVREQAERERNQAQVQNAKRREKELEGALLEAEERIAVLEGTLAGTRLERTDKEEAIRKELIADLSRVRDDLERERERSAALESDALLKTQEADTIGLLKAECATLRETRIQGQAEVEEMKERLCDSAAALETQKTETLRLRTHVGVLEGALSRCRRELPFLIAALENQSAECRDARREMGDLRTLAPGADEAAALLARRDYFVSSLKEGIEKMAAMKERGGEGRGEDTNTQRPSRQNLKAVTRGETEAEVRLPNPTWPITPRHPILPPSWHSGEGGAG